MAYHPGLDEVNGGIQQGQGQPITPGLQGVHAQTRALKCLQEMKTLQSTLTSIELSIVLFYSCNTNTRITSGLSPGERYRAITGEKPFDHVKLGHTDRPSKCRLLRTSFQGRFLGAVLDDAVLLAEAASGSHMLFHHELPSP